MHPATYATTDLGQLIEGLLAQADRTTAYSEIDAFEQVVRRAVVEHYPRRLPGNGSYPDREEIELALSYARFRLAGSHAFRIGDAALGRATDLPVLSPVPPAYIEFELAAAPEYAPGRTLRGAYVSRGEVGAITFLSDLARTRTRGNAMTVLLPSVMTHADIAGTAESRAGDGNEGDPDALQAAMLAQVSVAPWMMAAFADDPLAFSDDPWATPAQRKAKGDKTPRLPTAPRLPYISRYNTVLSESDFTDSPCPEFPRAVETVLRAAALARHAGGTYAAPRYLDGDDASMLSRNWMEDRDSDRAALSRREEEWRRGPADIAELT